MSPLRRAARRAGSDRPGVIGWTYLIVCGLVTAAALFVILTLLGAVVVGP